jgi:hypothetical protein
MRILEVAGIGFLAVLAGLLVIFVRREVISRAGGTIDMNMRLSTFVPGRGWAPGLGRFAGDELRWYRLFSFGIRPRRVLLRERLVVEDRRAPEGPERLAMPDGWVVVRCVGLMNGTHTGNGAGAAARRTAGERPTDGAALVELALAESAYAGFLSWLESAPPGALRRI